MKDRMPSSGTESKSGLTNLWSCVAVVLLVMLTGCVGIPVGTKKVSPRQSYLNLHQYALNSGKYSEEAAVVLHRYDLVETFKKDPVTALKQLHEKACTDERKDTLYALSELNYYNAERLSRSVKAGEPRKARDFYFASSVYAYLYLLSESKEGPPNRFDQRVIAACNLYNRGLALGLIAAGNTNALVELGSGLRHTVAGLVDVQFTQPGFPWKLEDFQAFYSSDEFIVYGLTTRNRDPGLGAPLIAVGKPVGNTRAPLPAPATVFLRVSGDVRSWSEGKLNATLELYSSYDSTKVEVGGRPVPLQTDTTAPIAFALNNAAIWKAGTAWFFKGEENVQKGIRLMQPYTAGRIPVVFVHGTASSPVWWAEMWNTLRADPVLSQRFQFWTFSYASGNPITFSANLLRQSLLDQIKSLDPDGKDPALQEMVIIGHSQGGLLAKLTATDTGDKIWKVISPDKSLDELGLDEKTRALVETNLFSKPLPCVKRVVFISTPHRGSYRNTSFVQNLLRRFINLPSQLLDSSANLLKLQEKVELPKQFSKGIPTSLSGMATDNPFALTLADIPVDPGIKANSIIAIQGDEQPPEGADGVVKYTSAHVDYAESEFIVRSFHSCQDKPATIEEVRRILLEHANMFPAERTPTSANK